MSIIVPVNQKDGSSTPMKLTRSKAIRQRCLDCSGFSASEVRNCEHTECQLHSLRMGKLEGMPGSERAKRISAYCTWCSGDQPNLKKDCPQDCPLFPFRYGTRLDRSSASASELKN